MAEKKGFLNWLFETEEQDESPKVVRKEADDSTQVMNNQEVLDTPEVQVAGDIVSEAYAYFKDSSFNIFLVEELYANFENIPEDTKNSLIRKNLETLGYKLQVAIDEAKERKNLIAEVTRKHQSDSEKIGEEIESQIAEAKTLIDTLSAKNIERINKLEAEVAGAQKELKRLNEILRILGGDD